MLHTQACSVAAAAAAATYRLAVERLLNLGLHAGHAYRTRGHSVVGRGAGNTHYSTQNGQENLQ